MSVESDERILLLENPVVDPNVVRYQLPAETSQVVIQTSFNSNNTAYVPEKQDVNPGNSVHNLPIYSTITSIPNNSITTNANQLIQSNGNASSMASARTVSPSSPLIKILQLIETQQGSVVAQDKKKAEISEQHAKLIGVDPLTGKKYVFPNLSSVSVVPQTVVPHTVISQPVVSQTTIPQTTFSQTVIANTVAPKREFTNSLAMSQNLIKSNENLTVLSPILSVNTNTMPEKKLQYKIVTVDSPEANKKLDNPTIEMKQLLEKTNSSELQTKILKKEKKKKFYQKKLKETRKNSPRRSML